MLSGMVPVNWLSARDRCSQAIELSERSRNQPCQLVAGEGQVFQVVEIAQRFRNRPRQLVVDEV